MFRKTALLPPGAVLFLGLSAATVAAPITGAALPQATAAQTDAPVRAPDNQPQHPSHASGPKRSAEGRIHGVTCSFPQVIEFRLEGEKKPLRLYNNNFAKIDLSVLGFNPSGPMNPCKDFEGKKAKVEYAETSDKTVDGMVVAVELKK